MKKCPYCAEEIQDEAILCRYCDSDITDSVQIITQRAKSDTIEQSVKPQGKFIELDGSKVFFAFVFLVLTNLSIGFLIYYLSSFIFGYDSDSAVAFGGLANLITRIILGSWAVKDRSFRNDLSGWSKFGIFILAFIPIGSWFAITYAARHITRNNQFRTLVFVGLLSIGLSILIFSTTVTLANTLLYPESNYVASSSKSTRSTSTPRPRPTSTPRTSTDNSSAGSNCYHWSDISRSMEGRVVCVYGNTFHIYSAGQTSTRIKFTPAANTFFIYSVNYIFTDLESGDCVVAEETVQLWENAIPFMATNDLYHCEPWMED